MSLNTAIRRHCGARPVAGHQVGVSVWSAIACRSWRGGRAIALAITLLPGLGLPAAFAQRAEHHLFRRVVLAPPGEWTEVVMPWTTEGWRIGAPDGPSATAADLARWQAAPGLVVVAGRCRGAQSGGTHYPCAFELQVSVPSGDSPVSGVAMLQPWQTTSDERLAHFDRGVVHAPSNAGGGMGPTARGLLQGVLPGDGRLLGFYAPGAVLLGADGRAAPVLRLRGVDNPLQHARFEREGLLVLSTRRLLQPPPALASSGRAI
jgi:hypothetical protein